MQQGPVMTVMQAQPEPHDKSNKRISFSVAALLADTRRPTSPAASPPPRHHADVSDEEDDVSVLGTPPSSPAPSTSGADDDRLLAASPLSSLAAAPPHSLAGIMAHVVAPVRPTPFSLAYGGQHHPAWPLHPGAHHNPFAGPFGAGGGVSPFMSGLAPGAGETRFILVAVTFIFYSHVKISWLNVSSKIAIP